MRILSIWRWRKIREILFRGRRVDNGQWVYGTPFQEYSDFWGEWEWIIQTKHPLTNVPYMRLQIDRKTVGQFTGLTDKNGKKIFEGDILKFTDENADYEWIGRVEFGNPNAEYNWGFQLVYIKGTKANTDILCWFDMEETGAYAEVIGNIHDNPELLENP